MTFAETVAWLFSWRGLVMCAAALVVGFEMSRYFETVNRAGRDADR
jgi:hypothetical protein